MWYSFKRKRRGSCRNDERGRRLDSRVGLKNVLVTSRHLTCHFVSVRGTQTILWLDVAWYLRCDGIRVVCDHLYGVTGKNRVIRGLFHARTPGGDTVSRLCLCVCVVMIRQHGFTAV